MKLSQVAPVWWCRQYNRWAIHLSPWRYAALIASGIAFGLTAGQLLAGIDRSFAERFQLFVTGWLMLFILFGTMRWQQRWREERRVTSGQARQPRH